MTSFSWLTPARIVVSVAAVHPFGSAQSVTLLPAEMTTPFGDIAIAWTFVTSGGVTGNGWHALVVHFPPPQS